MKLPERQIQETGLNIRLYLITDAIALTVDNNESYMTGVGNLFA